MALSIDTANDEMLEFVCSVLLWKCDEVKSLRHETTTIQMTMLSSPGYLRLCLEITQKHRPC